MQSEQIGKLAAALSKAQSEITGALKDSANPFYNSKYADLASVWDACRKALTENGLSVIQTTEPGRTFKGTIKTYNKKTDTEKVIDIEVSEIVVITTLAHESGEFVTGKLAMTPVEPTPQSVGSCLTYARRYALAAIVGVAQIDDDGNAASNVGHTKASPRDGMDLSGVDQDLAKQYAQNIRKALVAADIAEVKAIHDKLKSQYELYVVVGDNLTSKERSDLRKIVSKEGQ